MLRFRHSRKKRESGDPGSERRQRHAIPGTIFDCSLFLFYGLRGFGNVAWAISGRGGSVALALHSLAKQLAVTAHRFGLFPRPSFRALLVIAAQLHFSEDPFALHFFLQGAERLVDIIVANEDLHGGCSPWLVTYFDRPRLRPPAAIFSISAAGCEGCQE